MWGERRTVRMNENDFGTVGPSAGDSDVRHRCATYIYDLLFTDVFLLF